MSFRDMAVDKIPKGNRSVYWKVQGGQQISYAMFRKISISIIHEKNSS